jgi:hypothetical protein
MDETYIERLVNSPEWIRQVEESARRWDDLVARAMEGDEVALAEFRSDVVDVDALRAEYLDR